MNTNDKIREKIRTYLTSQGITILDLANRSGVTEGGIRAILSGKSSSPRFTSLEKIALAMGTTPAELMESAPPPKPEKTEQIPKTNVAPQIITDTRLLVSDRADLPVYASAQGGDDGVILDMGQIVEWVKTPAPLFGVKGAYAMYVVGDSMEPAFDQGDMLLIHPHKPAYKGNDVVVSKVSADGGETHVLIKRLVKATSDEVKLYQFNPPKEFSIPRSDVLNIHLVVGKYSRR